jgi:hypothetical protein
MESDSQKLDGIESAVYAVNDAVYEVKQEVGDEGPLAQELRAIYECLRTISRQLDDLSHRLDQDD